MFTQYFIEPMTTNYFNFTDRARRKEFWMFWLFSMLVYFATYASIFMVFGWFISLYTIHTILSVISVIFVIPNIALIVRRLHDLDKSGWWYLVSFVPLINIIFVIYIAFFEGTHGNNTYGRDPKTP